MITNDINVIYFQATQEDIDQLKNHFITDARKFCFFRKGGWAGFEHTYNSLIEYLKKNPELKIDSALYIPGEEISNDLTGELSKSDQNNFISSLVKIGKQPENTIILRVIYTEGSLSDEQKEKWQPVAGQSSLAEIPKIQDGSFRYLVNDNEFAFFSRLGPDDLRGMLGKDIKVIRLLCSIFLDEFHAALRNPQIEKNDNTLDILQKSSRIFINSLKW